MSRKNCKFERLIDAKTVMANTDTQKAAKALVREWAE